MSNDIHVYPMVPLNSVRPAVDNTSDKYSWNLYRWLRQYTRSNHFKYHPRIEVAQLTTRDGRPWGGTEKFCTGSLFLGYLDPDSENMWFTGARLASILVEPFPKGENRLSRNIGAMSIAGSIDHTDKFWMDYANHGRCAFDPGHALAMLGDEGRFINVSDDHRRCTWCGFEQHKETVEKTVTETRWVAVG